MSNRIEQYKIGNAPVMKEPTENNLPEGWVWAKIKYLVNINYGKGLKKERCNEGPFPVYGSNGVVGFHAVALTKGPPIILGRKGSIGAVHNLPSPYLPIDTTYFIDKFNGLYSKYLVHALRSLDLYELDSSTAIPGLNRDGLYDQHLPIAPLEEQRRIVAKIEELLARVNSAQERLTKVSVILKRFCQAVLSAACSGRLTEDWRSNQKELEPAIQLIERIRKTYREQYEAECYKAKKDGKRLPKKPEILE